MILKIKYSDGWLIYDNVEKVRYEYKKQKEAKSMDWAEFWGKELAENDNVAVLVYRKKDGMDKTMILTQSVYLCNDNGKTIEKIN